MKGTVIACAALVAAGTLTAASPVLQVVTPIVSQSDGGTPLPPGFTHVPGEVLFISFQVSGFTKDASEKVRIAWTVDALDPAGVKVTETIANEITAELAPQDKEWMPKARTEVALPPLAHSGAYKLVLTARDLVAKTSSEISVPFLVRGHQVARSDTLTIRNFRFFRNEDEPNALDKPIYRPGDPVWARFDITGYKFGKGNAVDVVYGVAVLTSAGKVLWSQAEAAVERTDSFYPKPWVPGSMSITLGKDFKPGDYAIGVQVKDAIGNQTFEEKYTFSVQ
jgi:hypothetical protein